MVSVRRSIRVLALLALNAQAALPPPKETVAEAQYPVRLITNEAGRVTADFGRAAFGWLEFDAPSTGGYFVVLGEVLSRDGTVDRHYSQNVRSAGASWWIREKGVHRVPLAPNLRNSFPAKEGAPIPVRREFGVVMPFRAVEFFEMPFEVTARNVRRMAVSYPADRDESRFTCSDGRLDKVYEFCRHTMFATSFTGQFVDGDRERIPYEADSYVSQLNWYAVSSDCSYPRTSIEYLYSHPTWPTEFKQCSISSAWADWMWTGDTGSIRRHYGLLKSEKTLERFVRESDGLLRTGGERPKSVLTNHLGAADIVDWPKCERDGFDFREVNAVVNAFRYRNLLEMEDIAGALGLKEDARMFAEKAARHHAAFQRAFFDGNTGLYVDGEGSSHSSFHANVAALAFGLVPEDRRRRVTDWVVSRGMACSVYFSNYLFEALFMNGREDAAIALLTASGDRSWLGMMALGATMTMEAWNMSVKPNMDWNHSWGAVPLNAISRFLLGVTPMEPGFAKISVRPRPGNLRRIDATVPTVKGPVHLRIDGDMLEVDTPAPARMVWGGSVKDVPRGRHLMKR